MHSRHGNNNNNSNRDCSSAKEIRKMHLQYNENSLSLSHSLALPLSPSRCPATMLRVADKCR